MHHRKKINLAISILLAVAIISGGLLGAYYFSLVQADRNFDNLAQKFHNVQNHKENSNGFDAQLQSERSIGFDELYAKNNDLVAWLTIEGTDIDYPVMYTPDNPEYYLRRNFEKEYSINGTPFIDGKCSLDPRSDNIIVHGHNMKNGSMFADLLLYQEKEFWETHPRIEFYTHDEKQTYEIIAVFRTEVYNEKLDFKYHSFVKAKNEQEFAAYIAKAHKASLYETGLTAQYGDRLLTLSTCAYHSLNGRFAILARAEDKKI